MASSPENACLCYGMYAWDVAKPKIVTVLINGIIFMTVITIWRVIFNFFVEGEAKKFASRQLIKKENKSSFLVNKDKYKESFWKSITTFPLMCYGFYVVWHAPYFFDTKLLFKDYPQPISDIELLYYKIALGYHGHRAIYGLFYEKKRSDYVAYVIHHWVTVGLIVGSWLLGLTQFGTIVMCLHDSADVFLAGAKTFSYHDSKIGVLFCFPTFSISWLLFRVILFPVKIIYPLIIYSYAYSCNPCYYFFVVGLCILYSLHVYWGQSIIGYLWVMVRKPKSKAILYDPRSGSEGEDDDINSNNENHKKKNGVTNHYANGPNTNTNTNTTKKKDQ